jgi:cytochrome c-type biogenesis protein CcmH
MSSILSLSGIFLFFVVLICAALFPLWKNSDQMSKRILMAVAICIPLFAIFSYTRLGAYEDLQIRDRYQGLVELAMQGQEIPEDEWQALLNRIQQRAERTNKAEYWYLLASSYEEMQQYELASDNYEKAAEIYAEDASILARWAESEFIAQGYNLTPKVQQIAERVLGLDPSNVTVLGVLGISAFQAGQAQAAIDFWTRALQGLPPNSENSQVIRASIMLAQQELIDSGEVLAESAQSQSAQPNAGIPLNISLASNLDIEPGNTVFVIARIPGSPMPTAVTRLTVGDLPTQISLDDSMVMIPGTNLMNLPLLEVVARISFSGQPTAQAGDYEVIESAIVPSELDGSIELILADQIQ